MEINIQEKEKSTFGTNFSAVGHLSIYILYVMMGEGGIWFFNDNYITLSKRFKLWVLLVTLLSSSSNKLVPPQTSVVLVG